MSSGPYQSWLLNTLNRQALHWQDEIGLRWRQMRSGLQWGVQVLLYPFYAAFQTGRHLGQQLGGTARTPQPLGHGTAHPAAPPPPDSPAPQAPLPTPEFQTLRSEVQPPSSTLQGPSSDSQIPLSQIPLSQIYSYSLHQTLTLARSLVQTEPDPRGAVRGLASRLDTRRLVLVDEHNAWIELSPDQEVLVRRILDRSEAGARTGFQSPPSLAVTSPRPSFPRPSFPRLRFPRLKAEGHPDATPGLAGLAKRTIQRSLQWGAQLGQTSLSWVNGWMGWMEHSPVAIATNLFQEALYPEVRSQEFIVHQTLQGTPVGLIEPGASLPEGQWLPEDQWPPALLSLTSSLDAPLATLEQISLGVVRQVGNRDRLEAALRWFFQPSAFKTAEHQTQPEPPLSPPPSQSLPDPWLLDAANPWPEPLASTLQLAMDLGQNADLAQLPPAPRSSDQRPPAPHSLAPHSPAQLPPARHFFPLGTWFNSWQTRLLGVLRSPTFLTRCDSRPPAAAPAQAVPQSVNPASEGGGQGIHALPPAPAPESGYPSPIHPNPSSARPPTSRPRQSLPVSTPSAHSRLPSSTGRSTTTGRSTATSRPTAKTGSLDRSAPRSPQPSSSQPPARHAAKAPSRFASPRSEGTPSERSLVPRDIAPPRRGDHWPIDTEVISSRYIKHPLETVLGWIDRILLTLELAIQWLWQHLWQRN